jgi:hypothetical protein
MGKTFKDSRGRNSYSSKLSERDRKKKEKREKKEFKKQSNF